MAGGRYCYRYYFSKNSQTMIISFDFSKLYNNYYYSQFFWAIKLNGIIVSEPEPSASTFHSYCNDIPVAQSINISHLYDQITEAENFEIINVGNNLK